MKTNSYIIKPQSGDNCFILPSDSFIQGQISKLISYGVQHHLLYEIMRDIADYMSREQVTTPSDFLKDMHLAIPNGGLTAVNENVLLAKQGASELSNYVMNKMKAFWPDITNRYFIFSRFIPHSGDILYIVTDF